MRILKDAAVIVLALCLVAGLCGCGYKFRLPFSVSSAASYPNGDQYTAGDRTISETIEKVDIDWTGGQVNLRAHSGSTVEIKEDTTFTATEEQRVHSWVEGSTLHIRFAASGAANLIITGEKRLTLTLPEDLNLKELTVDASSARVEGEKVKADKLTVSTTSGAVTLACRGEDILVDSTSGHVDLTISGEADSVLAATTSGGIEVKGETVKNLQASSTSGSISVRADVKDSLGSSSTSGSVRVETGLTPDSVSLETTSGSIGLSLPSDARFTARVSTTSGSFNSNFAMVQNRDTYTCGDGSADIRLGSTSGSITLNGC